MKIATLVLAALLLIIGGGLLVYGLNFSILQKSPLRLEIPAGQMWVDTGVDVSGKKVRIKYEGGVWKNYPTSSPCDGAGKAPFDEQEKLIVPSGNLAALVGKTDRGSFVVGNYKEGILGTGRLYLSINDKPGTFEDNSGSLFVTVEVLN